jgi:hypothetical protein
LEPDREIALIFDYDVLAIAEIVSLDEPIPVCPG